MTTLARSRARSRFACVCGAAALLLFVVGPVAAAEPLDAPTITVEESIEGFDDRRMHLLENLAGGDAALEILGDPARDVYGGRAIANLVLDQHRDEANERLRGVAEWFERPHPRGRDHQHEANFAAIKLARAYYMFEGTDALDPETVEKIERFFLTNDFQSRHNSENHKLIFYVGRFLMAQALPNETFEAYGESGRQLADHDREYLANFIRFRARQGWGEFGGTGYVDAVWKSLTSLHDYSEDEQLQRLAGMMLDLVLLDVVIESALNGLHGGAKGRSSGGHVIDHRNAATYVLQYVNIGHVDPDSFRRHINVDGMVTDYRPAEIVLRIALERDEPYVNRERKHLHNVHDGMPREPLEGSIRKKTLWTPEYILGAVTHQDPYPENHPGAWYAGHQQLQWNLTIATRTTSHIFSHHPGPNRPHGYWTGDARCGCNHSFQHKNAVLAMYDIPEDQPNQWIHAYVPRDSFDEVHEEDGVIFVNEGGVYAALIMVQGYEWTTEGRWADVEVVSDGSRHAVVCEVAPHEEVGSFEQFRQEILGNEIIFDKEDMTLTYRSQRNGEIRMDTGTLRMVDGEAVDLDYPTYDNPYMQSAWDSGIIEIAKGDRTMVLDFPDATRR